MAGNLRAEDNPPPALDGRGMRVGVVCGRFNDVITLRLLDGVRRGLTALGVHEADIVEEWVPGSFEIPYAAKLVAGSGVDAVICLGAVIRGETSHYDFVAGQCARGIQDVQLETGVPCAFGVITCDNMDQALARSGGGKRDQGRNGALTVARMALHKRELA
jgi:6,7-dimethyl-8-ribityllumazine synthase